MNRLHLTYLLLIPAAFVIMGTTTLVSPKDKIAVMIVSLLFAGLWIMFLIRDRKEETEVTRY